MIRTGEDDLWAVGRLNDTSRNGLLLLDLPATRALGMGLICLCHHRSFSELRYRTQNLGDGICPSSLVLVLVGIVVVVIATAAALAEDAGEDLGCLHVQERAEAADTSVAPAGVQLVETLCVLPLGIPLVLKLLQRELLLALTLTLSKLAGFPFLLFTAFLRISSRLPLQPGHLELALCVLPVLLCGHLQLFLLDRNLFFASHSLSLELVATACLRPFGFLPGLIHPEDEGLTFLLHVLTSAGFRTLCFLLLPLHAKLEVLPLTLDTFAVCSLLAICLVLLLGTLALPLLLLDATLLFHLGAPTLPLLSSKVLLTGQLHLLSLEAQLHLFAILGASALCVRLATLELLLVAFPLVLQLEGFHGPTTFRFCGQLGRVQTQLLKLKLALFLNALLLQLQP